LRLCAWGDTLFWNYGKEYGSAELREAFEASIAAGVTFFDTAEIYGMGLSEELLGEFVQQSGQSIAIATKYGPMLWRTGAQSVADALTASLKRLNVDQVALYQVHWPFTFLMSQQTLMNALADEVQRGRIEAVGVSNYSAAQMREARQLLAARGVRLATNQVRYSLLARQVEHQGITAAAKELGVTILAYSPLAQGLLTGKYTVDSYKQPTGARRIDPQFNRRGLEKIAPVLALLREFGDRYDRTPAQVALNWLIAQGNVIPIPGAKTAQQAQQNAGALGWQLQPDEVAHLSRAT
jgi:aryl-alcohol dehydrogenase-like predicted oxidoreductase